MRPSGIRTRVSARRILLLTAILTGALGASGAAQTGGNALELLREGVALRREGKDEAALQRFQRAYEIDRSPRALAQMGLAEQALGSWVLAYEHLTQALVATSDPWIATNGATLRASRDEVSQHVGRLEIHGGSPGAEVRIDGVVRGQLPFAQPLVLPIGSVTITIARTGFVPVQRVAVLRANQMTRESIEPLAPTSLGSVDDHTARAEIPANPQNGPPMPDPPVQSGPPRAAAPAPTGEGTSAGRASAKWIAWGAAALAAGVGLVGYAQQSSAGEQFNDSCYYDQTGTIRLKAKAPATVDQCSAFSGRVNTWYRTEVVGLVGAAALASVGLLLWLTEPTPVAMQTSGLACAPSLTGGTAVSMGCRWHF